MNIVLSAVLLSSFVLLNAGTVVSNKISNLDERDFLLTEYKNKLAKLVRDADFSKSEKKHLEDFLEEDKYNTFELKNLVSGEDSKSATSNLHKLKYNNLLDPVAEFVEPKQSDVVVVQKADNESDKRKPKPQNIGGKRKPVDDGGLSPRFQDKLKKDLTNEMQEEGLLEFLERKEYDELVLLVSALEGSGAKRRKYDKLLKLIREMIGRGEVEVTQKLEHLVAAMVKFESRHAKKMSRKKAASASVEKSGELKELVDLVDEANQEKSSDVSSESLDVPGESHSQRADDPAIPALVQEDMIEQLVEEIEELELAGQDLEVPSNVPEDVLHPEIPGIEQLTQKEVINQLFEEVQELELEQETAGFAEETRPDPAFLDELEDLQLQQELADLVQELGPSSNNQVEDLELADPELEIPSELPGIPVLTGKMRKLIDRKRIDNAHQDKLESEQDDLAKQELVDLVRKLEEQPRQDKIVPGQGTDSLENVDTQINDRTNNDHERKGTDKMRKLIDRKLIENAHQDKLESEQDHQRFQKYLGNQKYSKLARLLFEADNPNREKKTVVKLVSDKYEKILQLISDLDEAKAKEAVPVPRSQVLRNRNGVDIDTVPDTVEDQELSLIMELISDIDSEPQFEHKADRQELREPTFVLQDGENPLLREPGLHIPQAEPAGPDLQSVVSAAERNSNDEHLLEEVRRLKLQVDDLKRDRGNNLEVGPPSDDQLIDDDSNQLHNSEGSQEREEDLEVVEDIDPDNNSAADIPESDIPSGIIPLHREEPKPKSEIAHKQANLPGGTNMIKPNLAAKQHGDIGTVTSDQDQDVVVSNEKSIDNILDDEIGNILGANKKMQMSTSDSVTLTVSVVALLCVLLLILFTVTQWRMTVRTLKAEQTSSRTCLRNIHDDVRRLTGRGKARPLKDDEDTTDSESDLLSGSEESYRHMPV